MYDCPQCQQNKNRTVVSDQQFASISALLPLPPFTCTRKKKTHAFDLFRSVSGRTSGVRDARSSELDPSLRKRKQKHWLPSETCGKNTERHVRGGFGCGTYVASRLHVFKCLYLRTPPPGPRPTPPYTAQPPSAAMLSLVDQRVVEGASVATAAFLDPQGRVRASKAPPPERRKLRRSSANRHHATMSRGCRDGLHTVDTSSSVRQSTTWQKTQR